MHKKIKKILFVAIAFCSTFILYDKANAQLYNGSGGKVLGGSGYGSCGTQQNCIYNNKNMTIVKVTLYYIDSGNFSQQGKSFYWTDEYGYNFLHEDYDRIYKFEGLNECTKKTDKYTCASNKIRNYFGETGNYEVTVGAKKTLNYMLDKGNFDNASNYYSTILTSASELASRTSTAIKGYRIIIEPVLNVKNVKFANGTTSKTGILTVKELATTSNGTSCKNASSKCAGPLLGKGSMAQYLYTEFDDVGVKTGAGHCEQLTQEGLADIKDGCGYNIVDISQYANTKKCYTIEIEKNNPTCANTDANNKGEYTEKYIEKSCDDISKEEETNTENGKLMATNGNCKIYCIEKASVSFPGNISRKVSLNLISSENAYFPWPSRRNSSGLYKMSMTSTFDCKIINEKGGSCDNKVLTDAVKTTLTSNNMKFGAQLSGGTNKLFDGDLNVSSDITTDYDEEKLKYSKTVYFEIPSYKNRYYDRNTEVVSDNKNNFSIDRGEGVISLKNTDDISKNYELVIKNIKLGSDNRFGSVSDSFKYTCTYQIAQSPCNCPIDSVKEGYDLLRLSDKELEGMTCAELQEAECYKGFTCKTPSGGEIDINTCVKNKMKNEKISSNDAHVKCIQETEECSNGNTCIRKDGTVVDLDYCINEIGLSYNSCYNIYCERSMCETGTCCDEVNNNCSWQSDTLTKKNMYRYNLSTILNEKDYSDADLKNVKVYQKKCVDKENSGLVDEYCDTKVLVCPSGPKGMDDPTNCLTNILGTSVENALNNGREAEVNAAFAACEAVVCPTGNKIIYRVIDLDNPFPGKENKGTLIDFSNSGRGRMPGSNWNSEILVKEKILNARGAKGYDLYKKKPLYVITLTPSNIKEIREYNKNTAYSNFDMNCVGNDKTTKCISNFLHKDYSKIVTSGVCMRITNIEEFDTCYNGNN